MTIHARNDFLQTLADGTVKQVNPFTGTQVWTVPGRGNRPLGGKAGERRPLDPAQHGRWCAFCEHRYRETPPEKSRVIREGDRWRRIDGVAAADLDATTASFRRIPNLFEILSYEYWSANYGFELPPSVAARKADYLADPDGRAHVLAVVAHKLRASGMSAEAIAALSEDEQLEHASGFFGGGHDVIVGRRHFVDGAEHDGQLASSGTLSVEEHRQYMDLSVDTMRSLYENNRYARYVAVFQNWLKPAGASFDHLHKQAVAIDEHGPRNEDTLRALRANRNLFNDVGVNYAGYHNLLIAHNEHAVAFAGFGHRYPTIEVYSCSPTPSPWEQDPAERAAMSDVVHAMHAATGADVACNEEWLHQPVDVVEPMPWRIMLKWRVSTLAGFEGGTEVNINTISPTVLRDRIVPELRRLREEGRIADMRLGEEVVFRPNLLRYVG